MISRLPQFMSALVLASTMAVISLIHIQTSASVRDLAGHNLGQVHDRIVDHLREYFDIAERVSRVNRETIEMGRWDRHDLASWRGAFYAQVHGFETISSILWGDVFGGAVFVSRYPGELGYRFGVRIPAIGMHAAEYQLDDDGQLPDDPMTEYDYDPRIRPWYQAAVAAQKPVWGDIYTWVLKANMDPVLSVPFVAPVFGGGGEMLGVFDVEFSLHDLERFLSSLTIGRTGLTYVMDREGLLVASSVGVPVLDKITGRRVEAKQSSHPLIAASAKWAGHQLQGGVSTRVTGEFNEDGDEIMVMTTPFNRSDQPHWLAVTLAPVDDFMAPVKSARNLALLVAIIAVFASFALGHMILKVTGAATHE